MNNEDISMWMVNSGKCKGEFIAGRKDQAEEALRLLGCEGDEIQGIERPSLNVVHLSMGAMDVIARLGELPDGAIRIDDAIYFPKGYGE